MRIAVSRAPGAERVVTPLELFVLAQLIFTREAVGQVPVAVADTVAP